MNQEAQKLIDNFRKDASIFETYHFVLGLWRILGEKETLRVLGVSHKGVLTTEEVEKDLYTEVFDELWGDVDVTKCKEFEAEFPNRRMSIINYLDFAKANWDLAEVCPVRDFVLDSEGVLGLGESPIIGVYCALCTIYFDIPEEAFQGFDA